MAKDGSGVDKTYTISVSETVISYNYTLNYNTDGGTPSIQSYSTSSDDTQISTSVSSTIITKSGYTFKGWSTDLGDTYIDYAPGAQITLNPGTTTLYAVWERIQVTWTLTFDANGGNGAPAQVTAPVAGTQYVFTIPTQRPTLDGHTFTGWARSATSIGTYQPGGEFTAYEKDSVLYAIWEKETISNTFILLFEAGTSDPVSGLPGKIEQVNETATAEVGIPQNVPVRSGYKFMGWGEIAGTSVVKYAPGAEVVLNPGTKTLYAVWSQSDFSIVLNSNGGSTTDKTITRMGAGNVSIQIPNDYAPVRTGHTFMGWSTTADGEVEYNAGAMVDLTESAPHITLYAVWQEDTTEVTYTLTYHPNQGTGGPGQDTAVSTDGYAVVFVIKSTAPTRDGYDFLGWADSPDATVSVWEAEETFQPTNVNSTIYAVWRVQVNTWTLSFNANGGEFQPGYNPNLSESVTGDTHDFIVPTGVPVRQGYEFVGWGTSFDSSESAIVGTPGQPYTASKRDTTLYAVWREKPIVTIELTLDANGGSGAPSVGSVQATLPHKFTMPSDVPTLAGKRFLGWSETISGTEIVATPSGVYEAVDKRTTLYAVWGDIVEDSFILSFNANGGTGAPTAMTETGAHASFRFTIPDTEPVMDGFEFKGWSYDRTATSASLHVGDTVVVYSQTTLYAVWGIAGGDDQPNVMSTSQIVMVIAIALLAVFIIGRFVLGVF